MNEDRLRVSDILERLAWLEEAAGQDEERFHEDHWFREGIVRDLEVMGEAVKHVSAELRAAHPEVPWSDMAGFRDVSIHQYGRVDYASVWTALQHEIPVIREAMEAVARANGW